MLPAAMIPHFTFDLDIMRSSLLFSVKARHETLCLLDKSTLILD